MPDNNNKHEIRSVSDLVRILNEIGDPPVGHTRFFRGQGDASWDLLPGIYRKDRPELIKHEDKIIKEALLNCPDDFSPTDTLLEKLVKLQHYGYPTRLLDLTSNALVALYFTSENKEYHTANTVGGVLAQASKDGELIILDIPNDYLKYDDSDTVTILGALSLMGCDFNICDILEDLHFKHSYEVFKSRQEDCKYRLETTKDYNNGNEQLLKNYIEKNNITLKDFFDKHTSIRVNNLLVKCFNEEKDIVSLLHIIKHDRPSFRPVIKKEDLLKVLCVRAKYKNERISRQQGAFLIFGINCSKSLPAKLPEEWLQKLNGNKLIIKADAKANIMKELNSFGINKQFLFPELEKQAESIINQFS